MAVTDGQGRYHIEGLHPGSYTLRVELAIGENRLSRDVQVGDRDVQCDITLKGGRVAGTVVDSRGEPVVGARVSLAPEPPGGGRMADLHHAFHTDDGWYETDVSGAFSVDAVAPGAYYLVVSDETTPYEGPALAPKLLVVNKEADVDITGLRVVLEREAVVVAEPRAEDGRVPEYVYVIVCDAEGRVLAEADGDVDSLTGLCALRGLPPGRFSLVVYTKGHALLRQDVDIAKKGVTRIEMKFKTGRELAVTVVGTSGSPVPDAAVLLDPGGDPSLAIGLCGVEITDKSGRTRREHIPDGDYTLRVRRKGYQDAAAKVRIAGSDEEVTVTVQPGTD